VEHFLTDFFAACVVGNKFDCWLMIINACSSHAARDKSEMRKSVPVNYTKEDAARLWRVRTKSTHDTRLGKININMRVNTHSHPEHRLDKIENDED